MDGSRVFRAAILAAIVFPGPRAAIAQPPGDAARVARLVKTLGADEFAARRAADLELLQLGPESRRQLEQAAASADPEIRLRALHLLERAAVVRLWEPTQISVKSAGDQLSGVLNACAQQTGNHVFVGDPYSEFSNLPVTVDWHQQPYWQAIDELARATGNHLRVHYDSRVPGVVVAAGAAGKHPTAYSGPLRAQITSARRVFIEEFDYERLNSEVTYTFQLNLQLIWEDRFRLVAYGAQPEIIAAKTDSGVAVSGPPPSSGSWNVATTSTRQITASVRLNPPPVAATKLCELRLKWSLVALGEMAIADLENPVAEAELHHDGLSLKVLAWDRQPTGRVEMTLLVLRDLMVPEPAEILFQENVIELLDSQGRPLRSQSQTHTLTDQGVEFRLAFLGESAGAVPARLRVTYPKLRSRRDLEIVFRDVPLPVERPE